MTFFIVDMPVQSPLQAATGSPLAPTTLNIENPLAVEHSIVSNIQTQTCSSNPIPGGGTITWTSGRGGHPEIYVMDGSECNVIQFTQNGTYAINPAWSFDGSTLAYQANGYVLYLMNADGTNNRPLLTSAPPSNSQHYAAWSRDGSKIAFTMDVGWAALYLANSDGTGLTTLLSVPGRDVSKASWTPDGRIVYGDRTDPGNDAEIAIMNADGSNRHYLMPDNSSADAYPSVSPDGTKVAFVSNRDGNWEIYTMDFDGTNGSNVRRLTTNSAEDTWPHWSPDSTRLVFHSNRDGNEEIYVMYADGSNQTRITNNPSYDSLPVWGGPRIIVDSTAPVIVPVVSPTPNASGWNKTDVNVSWNVSDPETSITSSSGCGATTLTTETGGLTLTCSATNNAGLSNSVSVTVKIDKTAPAVTGSRTPAANANNWNNGDVTVSFNCTDTLSDVASVSAPTTLSNEGMNQSVTGTCTDKAGNSASVTVANISIDKTAPSINIVAPMSSALYLQNQVVKANYNCSDALSGAVTCTGTVPSGNNIDTSTVGSKNFVVNAVDKADNSATKSLAYNIWGVVGPFPPLVKNGQGTGQFKSGSTVPVKFQLTDGSNLVTTAVGTISIDASTAEIRWDSSAQQYIANVKLLSTSGTYPVTLNVNGVGSVTIATITVR